MKCIFDYTYYRVAKFYFKRDGLGAFTALLTISLIYAFYLMDIFFLVKDSFFFVAKRNEVFILEKIIVLLVGLFIYIIKKNIKGSTFFSEKNGVKSQKVKHK